MDIKIEVILTCLIFQYILVAREKHIFIMSNSDWLSTPQVLLNNITGGMFTGLIFDELKLCRYIKMDEVGELIQALYAFLLARSDEDFQGFGLPKSCSHDVARRLLGGAMLYALLGEFYLDGCIEMMSIGMDPAKYYEIRPNPTIPNWIAIMGNIDEGVRHSAGIIFQKSTICFTGGCKEKVAFYLAWFFNMYRKRRNTLPDNDYTLKWWHRIAFIQEIEEPKSE